ncbi:MAG: DNA repair protein RecO [Alphaproteobacteria bacterium]|jgi:DNA repair protein RecO (recombination protein O)
MNWSDEGIVLSARKHGESAAIVTLMTRDHGRHAGLVRGGAGSRARGLYQTGNLLSADWRARLSEHLGTYTCELVRPYAAGLLTERLPLRALASAAALVERLLPERAPHPETYENLIRLIEVLTGGNGWLTAYVHWELDLLGDLGYGLDLSCCAATGSTEDLVYVSPRTGCAVSAGAGAPYREKLLALPAFVTSETVSPDAAAVLDGLRLTGHFLERCAKEADAGDLPDARGRFMEGIRRSAAGAA